MKALALLSGGLDSTLAIKVIQDLGIEVEAINFTSPFCRCSGAGSGCSAAANAARQLDVKLHYYRCGEDYLRLIEAPPHGYGKRMNPCLDCRIYKFKLAKEKMDQIGASFLITGEVIDQRPNSQRRDALDIVERDSGLRGYILRPLCARHLRPTIPEENGWVERVKLLDIRGRGRRRQMDLAESFGIADYPCPAGGCLLTCEEYSLKIRDLLQYEKSLTPHSISLLQYGRQLRLSPQIKIIVGKDEVENSKLRSAAAPPEFLLETAEHPGPVTLYCGPPEPGLLKLAAAITAGYSSVPENSRVKVNIESNGILQSVISVVPLPRAAIRPYFIYSC
jgi:tRNA-specific 2-thiouridylase